MIRRILLIEELVAARVLRRRRQDGVAWIELGFPDA
jgi:hypothetical protein